MSIFYSAATGGFYDSAIHQTLPPDALAISGEQHRLLLDGQSEGLVIAPNAMGAPVLEEPQPPTLDQLMERMRTERDRLLRASDWTQMPDSPLDIAGRDAWAGYRHALRDLPEAITDPTNIEWPAPPAK